MSRNDYDETIAYQNEDGRLNTEESPPSQAELDWYRRNQAKAESEEITESAIDDTVVINNTNEVPISDKELKKQNLNIKREKTVPIYKWFFVLLFLLIPILNIFLIIYWGFFSERINKNIRNFILASFLLVIVFIVLSIFSYFNLDALDPRLLAIINEFSNEFGLAISNFLDKFQNLMPYLRF